MSVKNKNKKFGSHSKKSGFIFNWSKFNWSKIFFAILITTLIAGLSIYLYGIYNVKLILFAIRILGNFRKLPENSDGWTEIIQFHINKINLCKIEGQHDGPTVLHYLVKAVDHIPSQKCVYLVGFFERKRPDLVKKTLSDILNDINLQPGNILYENTLNIAQNCPFSFESLIFLLTIAIITRLQSSLHSKVFFNPTEFKKLFSEIRQDLYSEFIPTDK